MDPLEHPLESLAGTQIRSGDIHVHDLLPTRQVQFHDRRGGAARARIVDEDVEPPKAANHLANHPAHLVLPANIRRNDERRLPAGPRQACRLLELLLLTADKGYPRALLNQVQGDTPADALPRAGHDGHLVTKRKRVTHAVPSGNFANGSRKKSLRGSRTQPGITHRPGFPEQRAGVRPSPPSWRDFA